MELDITQTTQLINQLLSESTAEPRAHPVTGEHLPGTGSFIQAFNACSAQLARRGNQLSAEAETLALHSLQHLRNIIDTDQTLARHLEAT